MDMTLTALYEQVPKSEGDGYVAYVEELPGAISEGDTLEEARENLRDAVELRLEANRDLAGQRISGKKVTPEKDHGLGRLTFSVTIPTWTSVHLVIDFAWTR
jgi:predicted RNase H-like HicB family nuclease